MIGGYAVIAHGYYRSTGDLDVWVRRSPANAERLIEALVEFGFGSSALTQELLLKPGAILLSQMSQRPIVPMAYAASRATLFQWDKFVLPWPFSRIVIAVGEPRQVPRAIPPSALEAWQKDMAAEMKTLFARARDALDGRAAA